MKIALLGSTGFVGTVLLKKALAQGHQLKVLARSPEKIGGANLGEIHCYSVTLDTKQGRKMSTIDRCQLSTKENFLRYFRPHWKTKTKKQKGVWVD